MLGYKKACNYELQALDNFYIVLAEWTGLEPATPCVTGMYSNQLNYHSVWDCKYKEILYLHKLLAKKTFNSRLLI